MKKTLICILICLTAASFAATPLTAQSKGKGKPDWMERLQSHKIAFLTDKMELTSAEAQVFWPIYNKAEEETHEAFTEVFSAYEALVKAVDEGKGDKEVERLLDAYNKAKEASSGLEAKHIKEYKSVLPASKVAKLYIGEEEFRRNQIHNFGRGPK